MPSTLHDLEEDYDPFYSNYGVPGSNLDMNLCEHGDIQECAKMIGAIPVCPDII